jgi:hypothetical protein
VILLRHVPIATWTLAVGALGVALLVALVGGVLWALLAVWRGLYGELVLLVPRPDPRLDGPSLDRPHRARTNVSRMSRVRARDTGLDPRRPTGGVRAQR